MDTSRRCFVKAMGLAGLSGTPVLCAAGRVFGSDTNGDSADGMGVLVDLPMCIGCRKCEYACQQAAGFDVAPLETFEDKSVFARQRRPAPSCFTVVNQYANPKDESKPVYVKSNCLHCKDPACVSACLVGALRKEHTGAVVYGAWKCMGCRYCMVACPFQIPTYEYDNTLTPQVRKCNLCAGKIDSNGGVPSCVKICPRECLIYGKRSELLVIAHEKIRAQPDLYVDHVYGEHEVGGTSWLYLSSEPFEKLGFLPLGADSPPRLTESIQHAVFKHWVPPVALYGLLATAMWLTRPERPRRDEDDREVEAGEEPAGDRASEELRLPVEVGEEA